MMGSVLSHPVKTEMQYNHKITISLLSVLHTFLKLPSASPWIVFTLSYEDCFYAFWG